MTFRALWNTLILEHQQQGSKFIVVGFLAGWCPEAKFLFWSCIVFSVRIPRWRNLRLIFIVWNFRLRLFCKNFIYFFLLVDLCGKYIRFKLTCLSLDCLFVLVLDFLYFADVVADQSTSPQAKNPTLQSQPLSFLSTHSPKSLQYCLRLFYSAHIMCLCLNLFKKYEKIYFV